MRAEIVGLANVVFALLFVGFFLGGHFGIAVECGTSMDAPNCRLAQAQFFAGPVLLVAQALFGLGALFSWWIARRIGSGFAVLGLLILVYGCAG